MTYRNLSDPARHQALNIDAAETFKDAVSALQYCAHTPSDIAALAVCANYLRNSGPLGVLFMEQLCTHQGLTFGYETHLASKAPNVSNDGAGRMPADSPVNIIIGANHTGTLSLMESLRRLLGNDQVFELPDYATVSKGTDMPSLQADIQYLRGLFNGMETHPRLIYCHRPVPIHMSLRPTTSFRYLTMLRNPISRFVAVYYWLVKHRHTNHHWMHPLVKEGCTLEEYVDHHIAHGSYPGGLAPGTYYFHNWRELGLIPGDIVKDRVKSVTYILEKYFSFVGITELFDESLYLMSQHLGLTSLPRWGLRGNSDRPSLADISPSVIRKIDHISEADTAIYRYFRSKLEHEHAEQIAEFRETITTLRMDNDAVSTKPEFN